jgi:PAS domain S-box-containing protein
MMEALAIVILESISEAVVALDRDWRYSYVNAAAERMSGIRREQILGQSRWDIFPGIPAEHFESFCRRAMAEGVTIQVERYEPTLGLWFEETAHPSADGLAVHIRDITKRKQAESSLTTEERLRRYFDLGLIGAAITSLSKGILEVNDKICEILGYERGELLRKTWAELTHPDDLGSDVELLNRVIAGEIDGYSLNKRWVRKDGRIIDSVISVKCMRTPDGSVDCFVALLQDVTESRRAEEDRERFALFVENSSDFIGICDLELKPLYLNRSGREMVGLENREDVFRKSLADFFFPEDLAFIRDDFIPRVLRNGDGKVEVRFRHFKTGEPIWMICSALLIRDGRGAPAGLATISLNITQRRHTEEELRQARSELELRVAERTRELQIANDELAADLEAMRRLNELSRRLLAADGLDSILRELLNATIDLQHAAFGMVQIYNPNTKALELAVQQGFKHEVLDYFRLVEGESTAHRRAMQWRQRVVIEDVETDAGFEPHRHIAAKAGFRAVQSTPLFTPGGEPLGMLSTQFRDPHRPSERELRLTDLYARQAGQMIERHRVEETLLRNEAYLSIGQRLSHTGSGNLNLLTGEMFWTDETYRIFGYEPRSITPSAQLFLELVLHPEDRPLLEGVFAQAIRDQSKCDLNFRIVRRDGSIRYIRGVGEPTPGEDGAVVEMIGIIMDVTEQKLAADALDKAHGELARIARATTIGELAASIAHEANQPIAAIVSNGEACLKWIDRPEPDWMEAQAAVRRMVAEGQRASEVIQRVRSLMKRAPVQMLALELNELVAELLTLVQRDVVSHSISLRTELAHDLPQVKGDRIHLQQVFVNLLRNAIESIAERGEGPRRIVIGTRLHWPEKVVVSICDTGVGIPAEDAEQLFQPFYSNKAGGMGMGLWISRSIVEAHGGMLWATVNEDAGATFHFTIPVARRVDHEEPAPLQ